MEDFQNRGSLADFFEAGIDSTLIECESRVAEVDAYVHWQPYATAITNYFNSFKDINELDLDEINAFVDNIATVDLQYGYTVNTGNDDRAIISFGIRNIFTKEHKIFNSNM